MLSPNEQVGCFFRRLPWLGARELGAKDQEQAFKLAYRAGKHGHRTVSAWRNCPSPSRRYSFLQIMLYNRFIKLPRKKQSDLGREKRRFNSCFQMGSDSGREKRHFNSCAQNQGRQSRCVMLSPNEQVDCIFRRLPWLGARELGAKDQEQAFKLAYSAGKALP